jgi:hypothetical protein
MLGYDLPKKYGHFGLRNCIVKNSDFGAKVWIK